jgi:hypothetical protein
MREGLSFVEFVAVIFENNNTIKEQQVSQSSYSLTVIKSCFQTINTNNYQNDERTQHSTTAGVPQSITITTRKAREKSVADA